jgi:hypothetical protein
MKFIREFEQKATKGTKTDKDWVSDVITRQFFLRARTSKKDSRTEVTVVTEDVFSGLIRPALVQSRP